MGEGGAGGDSLWRGYNCGGAPAGGRRRARNGGGRGLGCCKGHLASTL